MLGEIFSVVGALSGTYGIPVSGVMVWILFATLRLIATRFVLSMVMEDGGTF